MASILLTDQRKLFQCLEEIETVLADPETNLEITDLDLIQEKCTKISDLAQLKKSAMPSVAVKDTEPDQRCNEPTGADLASFIEMAAASPTSTPEESESPWGDSLGLLPGRLTLYLPLDDSKDQKLEAEKMVSTPIADDSKPKLDAKPLTTVPPKTTPPTQSNVAAAPSQPVALATKPSKGKSMLALDPHCTTPKAITNNYNVQANPFVPSMLTTPEAHPQVRVVVAPTPPSPAVGLFRGPLLAPTTSEPSVASPPIQTFPNVMVINPNAQQQPTVKVGGPPPTPSGASAKRPPVTPVANTPKPLAKTMPPMVPPSPLPFQPFSNSPLMMPHHHPLHPGVPVGIHPSVAGMPTLMLSPFPLHTAPPVAPIATDLIPGFPPVSSSEPKPDPSDAFMHHSFSSNASSSVPQSALTDRVLEILRETGGRPNAKPGWEALGQIWGISQRDLDDAVMAALATKTPKQQAEILLSMSAIDLSNISNLSAYLNCLIKEHDNNSQVCMHFLVDLCDDADCTSVHPVNTPGWDLLRDRWGICFRDLDYAVLNYLSKKTPEERDEILISVADMNLGAIKNLSAYLSSTIQKYEMANQGKPGSSGTVGIAKSGLNNNLKKKSMGASNTQQFYPNAQQQVWNRSGVRS